jgi:hypothetical protein
MLEQLEQDQLIAFVTGLWCIWKRRNDKIWENKEIRPEIAFQIAQDNLHQWRVVSARGERRASEQRSRNTQRNAVAAQQHNAVAEQQQQQYNDRAESSVQGARRAAGQEFQNRINTEVGQWTVPTIGELKCNVDAAIFKDVNMFGAGMCIRDDKGRFIHAQTIWSAGQPSPQEA